MGKRRRHIRRGRVGTTRARRDGESWLSDSTVASFPSAASRGRLLGRKGLLPKEVPALEFYLDKLGFEKRADFLYGGGNRWIEVAPPGATNTISLVPPGEGKSAGGDAAYCAFASEDIEADHATLRARGVDVDPEIARQGKRRAGLISLDATIKDPVPPQFFFRDLDGNRFLIVEPG